MSSILSGTVVLETSNIGEMWVVGVGPGKPEYVTLKVAKLIERANYVAGFKQALQVMENLAKGKILIIDYTNEEGTIKLLASEAKASKKCVICCYGDPNFSDKQFVEKIKSVCMNVKMVPGISSVQVSCAKAGLAMEDSIFKSFHKNGPINSEEEELLRVVKEGRRDAIVLPKPWDFLPKDIAKFLIENGVEKNLEATVHKNLTLSDEIVHVCKISDLLNTEHSDLSIIILKKRGPRPVTLPPEDFMRYA